MALNKSKKNLILSLKIQIIGIYALLDLILWYFFMWFSIYEKSAFPFYGVKILFAIIAFILFLSYCKKWERGEKVKIATKVVKLFSIFSVLGSVIEIIIFAFLNRETYMYMSLGAGFASLLSSGAICSLYALVFRFASNKSELEENINAFYLPLIFKVVYTIYFFFSCVAFGLILNYIRIREESYLNLYKDEVLNEVLTVNNNINNNYDYTIKNNDLLSSWSYVNYKLSDKNIVYSSDDKFLNQSVYNLFNSQGEFYKNINDFESKIRNNSIFYIAPIFNMNKNAKTVAIFSYIKNLDIVSIYYKDVNSIIKNSHIEKNISLFMIFFGVVYILLSAVYINILRYTFNPIKIANKSTRALREENRDLRKRIVCKNNDEIGVLVYNFNLFINDLELIIDNLKSKSENLTNDINNIEKIMEENSDSVNFQTESIKKSVVSIETIIDSIRNITGSTEQQRTAFSSASLAVEDLLQTIYKINDNIERQFSSVEQTSASVEEMISNIRSISRNTNNADTLFKKLLVEAEDGAEIVEEVIESIRNVESSNEQIKNIINIIQNIADQTNLLAMNAAIEASHAGDAGKGFSVIADEIRSLAEHTAENTKSITAIIKGITRRIEESVELANNSGKSLNNILNISENASMLISEINTANNELEIGGKDILETITKLNDTTSGVKDSVKEQISSGDTVDSQITLLDKISREVMNVVEAKSMDVNEVNNSISSLNSLSNQIIENRDKFYNMTNRLNSNFTIFNTLLMNFITNRDTKIEEEKNKKALLKDDKFSIEKEIEYQLKTLEEELKISEDDDEEVLNTLKEDFKNPNMFY